jgi:hypothetical protein
MDLDSNDFFDPRIRNVIVLDDLTSTAAKNPRINDFFTEGSHHRNLTVIALNQNMYFGKDPTQRRNCHYLVLFNNPIDRQPIAMLGRQIYPGRAHGFLHKFEVVTDESSSYLVVDLKPETPEWRRLCTKVFEEEASDDMQTDQMDSLATTSNSLRLRTDVLGTCIEKWNDKEEEDEAEEVDEAEEEEEEEVEGAEEEEEVEVEAEDDDEEEMEEQEKHPDLLAC